MSELPFTSDAPKSLLRIRLLCLVALGAGALPWLVLFIPMLMVATDSPEMSGSLESAALIIAYVALPLVAILGSVVSVLAQKRSHPGLMWAAQIVALLAALPMLGVALYVVFGL